MVDNRFNCLMKQIFVSLLIFSIFDLLGKLLLLLIKYLRQFTHTQKVCLGPVLEHFVYALLAMLLLDHGGTSWQKCEFHSWDVKEKRRQGSPQRAHLQ